MARKGSWITAIKKAFSSREKPNNEYLEKRSRKEKLNLQEVRSFIPIFRQPSSIEKILGDVEREHHKVLNKPQSLPSEKHPWKTNVNLRTTSSRHGSLRIGSPRAAASPRATSLRIASPNTSLNRNIYPSVSLPKASSSKTVPHNKPSNSYRPEPTLAYRHVSATRIQAVYRGYIARRSFRALRGLVRLQGVVRGQNVQRQTANAMRQMQFMVRVKTQIQSRRIQLLENQALRHHNQYNTDNDSFSKWRMASESGNADWEDSVLTKEEIEARMQRKMEAAVKRERAMAYAYSHAQLKGTPKSPLDNFADHCSSSFPWWWNWLERRLPSKQLQESSAIRIPHPTPPRTALPTRMSTTPSPQPQSRNQKQHTFESDPYDSLTQRSTKSSFIPQWKPSQTPTPRRFMQLKTPNRPKYPKPRPTGADSPFDPTVKDDDSLNSCPAFSAPSYMAPTASAKAKVKSTNINTPIDKPTATDTPSRRFSFPLMQGIGSFKWNKTSSSSPFSHKDAINDNSERTLDKVESFHSAGNLSVESTTTSLPARGTGKKSFNRFV